MSNDRNKADGAGPSFAAYLNSRNIRRLHFASWYFSATMVALLAVNLALPLLRVLDLSIVEMMSAVYFGALAPVCRQQRTLDWPPQLLPLLFGTGVVLTGLLFSVSLAPRFGATPAYATAVFVACLAPLWPRGALLAMLLPIHGLYLVSVFGFSTDTVFRTVMTMGGTAALPLGAAVAILAFRGERQAYDDMAAIRALLDERRDLVAMVAHDLQSPLAGIRALLRTVSGPSAADAGKLAEIARTCGDMYGAVTKLVQAHQDDRAGPAALATIAVDTALREARDKAQSIAADKAITLIAAPSALAVSAAPSHLSAILDNLVANAIKFSAAGSTVRLVAEPQERMVRISVVDNGPGITREDMPLLFRRFTRLRAQPTDGESSSGLGLYIVRTLAERMGARAGVAPNPDGGSIFYVDVPAAGPSPPASATTIDASASRTRYIPR
jgi:signal transduction histidine kinase